MKTLLAVYYFFLILPTPNYLGGFLHIFMHLHYVLKIVKKKLFIYVVF